MLYTKVRVADRVQGIFSVVRIGTLPRLEGGGALASGRGGGGGGRSPNADEGINTVL
jgi:hypothetical protein